MNISKSYVMIILSFLAIFIMTAGINGVSAKDFNTSSTSDEIQSFIDSEDSDNIISLDEGNYTLKDLNITRNVTFKSKNNGVVNFKGDGTYNLFNIKSNNVTIDGLNIIDYKIAIYSTANYLTVQNCKITTTNKYLYNTTGIVINITNNITNNIINNITNNGSNGSGDTYLKNNIIESNVINVKYEAVIFNINSTNGEIACIENNTIKNNTLESWASSPIYLNNPANIRSLKIEFNTFNGSGTAIYLSSENITDITISNNNITFNGEHGTIINISFIYNARNIQIIDNNLSTTSDAIGVTISSKYRGSVINTTKMTNITFNNNKIQNQGTFAIIIDNNFGSIEGIYLNQNKMRGFNLVTVYMDGINITNNNFSSRNEFTKIENYIHWGALVSLTNFYVANNTFNDILVYLRGNGSINNNCFTNFTFINNTGDQLFYIESTGSLKNFHIENNIASMQFLFQSMIEDVYIINNDGGLGFSSPLLVTNGGSFNNISIINNHLNSLYFSNSNQNLSNIYIINNSFPSLNINPQQFTGDLLIANNTIKSDRNDGISLNIGNLFDGAIFTIENNNINMSNGTGINILFGLNSIVEKLSIFNNTINTNGTNSKGIYLSGNNFNNTKIIGNSITAGSNGIEISSNGVNNIKNITINYNSILSPNYLVSLSTLATGSLDYNFWGSNILNSNKFRNTPVIANYYKVKLFANGAANVGDIVLVNPVLNTTGDSTGVDKLANILITVNNNGWNFSTLLKGGEVEILAKGAYYIEFGDARLDLNIGSIEDSYLEIKNYTGEEGKVIRITARLKTSKGNGIPGKTIVFMIGDKRYFRTTDSNGIATFDHLMNESGNFTINVRFAGDGDFYGVNGSAILTVNPFFDLNDTDEEYGSKYVSRKLTNAEIQKLIDDAPEGYTFYFKGVYNNLNLVLHKKVNIVSEGATFKGTGTTFTITGSDILIEGFNITTTGTAFEIKGGKDVKIHNNSVYNSNMAVNLINNPSNVEICHNNFIADRIGINILSNVSTLNIHENIINGTGGQAAQQGIINIFGILFYKGVTNLTIKKNLIGEFYAGIRFEYDYSDINTNLSGVEFNTIYGSHFEVQLVSITTPILGYNWYGSSTNPAFCVRFRNVAKLIQSRFVCDNAIGLFHLEFFYTEDGVEHMVTNEILPNNVKFTLNSIGGTVIETVDGVAYINFTSRINNNVASTNIITASVLGDLWTITLTTKEMVDAFEDVERNPDIINDWGKPKSNNNSGGNNQGNNNNNGNSNNNGTSGNGNNGNGDGLGDGDGKGLGNGTGDGKGLGNESITNDTNTNDRVTGNFKNGGSSTPAIAHAATVSAFSNVGGHSGGHESSTKDSVAYEITENKKEPITEENNFVKTMVIFIAVGVFLIIGMLLRRRKDTRI